MLGFEYHPAAESEYLAAVRWYAEREVQLGYDFVKEVEAAVQRARQFPEAWQILPGNFRRVRCRRFPYGIIYSVLQDRILIWAVAHNSRDPEYWRSR